MFFRSYSFSETLKRYKEKEKTNPSKASQSTVFTHSFSHTFSLGSKQSPNIMVVGLKIAFLELPYIFWILHSHYGNHEENIYQISNLCSRLPSLAFHSI